MKDRWSHYLNREISIKYKAGIYSLCHLFYCACYLMWWDTFSISLLQITEIAFLSYFICNLQVFAFNNFDEADSVAGKWWVSALLCTGLYLLAVYFMDWFDDHVLVILGFGAWQPFCYYCVYLVNKVKRHIDTKNLNQLLEAYKKGKGQDYD